MSLNRLIFGRILIVVIVFCQSCLTYNEHIVRGDQCNVERTEEDGIYTFAEDCPATMRDAKKSIYPEIYGFENNRYIVCCSIEDSAVTQLDDQRTDASNPVEPFFIPSEEPVTVNSNSSLNPLEQKIGGDRVSVRKCSDYHDELFQLPSRSKLSGSAEEDCPISVGFHINGGTAADGKEFPHMALIYFSDDHWNISWHCGGSLISEEFVLTAAHCLSARINGTLQVRLGELDYKDENDEAKPISIDVGEIIMHPNYTTRYKYDDIGLIRLATPVQLNEYIRPICLPESSSIPKDPVATGWGKNDTDGEVSTSMQKVDVNLYTYEECNGFHGPLLPRGIINETQFCAKDRDGSGDTCQGDSGGPLQLQHDKHTCMYTIVGITSAGPSSPCGSRIPGIYTRVSSYIDWIEGIVWPNEP